MTRPRAIIVYLHRIAGLATAVFLIVAGVTGSIIAFSEELDAWLNPELFFAQSGGPALDADALAAIVERHEPNGEIWRVNLSPAPGRSAMVEVEPKPGAALAYNEIFLDPVTGAVLGQRWWGALRVDRAHFVGFVYRLHEELHLPDPWGRWLMGGVAIVWMVDCFLGLYLTLPRRRAFAKWRYSWLVRWNRGGYRINFDLHRASGLWLWPLLLILAVSSVSLNLREEAFVPVVSAVSPLTPDPFVLREAQDRPLEPRLTFSDALARSDEEGARLGWPVRAEAIGYAPGYDIFFARFRLQGSFSDEWRWIYLDGQDGRSLGSEWLGQGTAGDIFTQAQYPLHSGRLLGLPGRIIVAITGVATALLSVTGIVIWWRKANRRRVSGELHA